MISVGILSALVSSRVAVSFSRAWKSKGAFGVQLIKAFPVFDEGFRCGSAIAGGNVAADAICDRRYFSHRGGRDLAELWEEVEGRGFIDGQAGDAARPLLGDMQGNGAAIGVTDKVHGCTLCVDQG